MIRMSTYEGTSTIGNEPDSKVEQILHGEHVAINVDL